MVGPSYEELLEMAAEMIEELGSLSALELGVDMSDMQCETCGQAPRPSSFIDQATFDRWQRLIDEAKRQTDRERRQKRPRTA